MSFLDHIGLGHLDRHNKLDKLGNKVEHVDDTIKDEVKEAVAEVVEEVGTAFTEKLPELAEDALREVITKATAASAKRGLGIALDMVELVSPRRYGLIIGVELALIATVEFTVTVVIPNPTAKLTEIRKWARRPPRSRKQIIKCVKDFGPESLTVEAKVSGNGGFAEWDGHDMLDRLDVFLAKQGVN